MDWVIVLWCDGILMIQQQLTGQKKQGSMFVKGRLKHLGTDWQENIFEHVHFSLQWERFDTEKSKSKGQTHCVSVDNLPNGDVDDRFGDSD